MPEIVPMAQGPKTLTFKLEPAMHMKFLNLARQLELSPNLLAQEVIDHFMADYEKEEADREYPPIGAKT